MTFYISIFLYVLSYRVVCCNPIFFIFVFTKTENMGTNELRIGNIVDTLTQSCEISLPRNYPQKIGNIEFFSVHLYEVSKPFSQQGLVIKTDIKNICPIKLSEEWFIKLGFELNDDISLPYQKAFIKEGIIFNEDKFLCTEDNEGNVIFIGNELKYVHQLQNLYFALTGEELL